jgi:predicted ArsR family transcriptional regulator
MPITDKLPPLAVELLRTLRQTYDHRGPDAFDEDATKVFQVIGSIIAQVCGRERLAETMERLDATLTMEGIGESNDGAVRPVH